MRDQQYPVEKVDVSNNLGEFFIKFTVCPPSHDPSDIWSSQWSELAKEEELWWLYFFLNFTTGVCADRVVNKDNFEIKITFVDPGLKTVHNCILVVRAWCEMHEVVLKFAP